ncbi:MAG: alpha/beta hydrolase [Roseiarcus sp.]|uniref:alpha/beta hydrolase n=1 Tax=Roseiarcus sp. TaxID=1969460 RepID=UPI003C6B6B1A
MVKETAARRPRAAILVVLGFAIVAAGCSSRPYGNLIVGTSAPGASQVDLLVATTRAPVLEPPGVMFGGARGRGLDFADVVVSVPPDSARKAGEVQWPSSPPGDPERDFVTLRADRLDLAEAKANFNARVSHTPGRKVLIFVHGYNTRFEEAVYKFAQIVHDAHVDVAPVLFTWPSGGSLVDYVYDRDSAMYSRDAFESVLQALVDDKNVGSISILAHSMGNYLAVEALRQMAIRDRGLPSKIHDVMLASPDIDVDVFRRQIAQIDVKPRTTQFTLFVSRDDKALGISSFLARDSTRLGALDPTTEPYSSMLEKAQVNVIDLTGVASNDSANHSKFATSEVVAAIGDRLAQGQALNDAQPGVVESLGVFTHGAISIAADAATAPTRIVDQTASEKSVDTAAGSVTLDK